MERQSQRAPFSQQDLIKFKYRLHTRKTKVQSHVNSYQRRKKMLLDTSLHNAEHYKVRIKGKWTNPGKEVAPSQCFSVVAM